MYEDLRVDGKRLWHSHMDIGKIGALPGGGNCRLTLTDEDREARELFISWCRTAGCEVDFDRVGNIFVHRPGRNEDLAPVMCGSHLDTQPHGGKFDGIYGVLAGLEVIRTLNDNGVETERPIEVTVWINEEGIRFPIGVAGSGAFAGVYTADELLALGSQDGCLWGDELARCGFAGKEEPGNRPVDSFFEVHIEQGPILENAAKTIGIVTGAQGIRWLDVVVRGSDSHAGTTPLTMRKDALLAAARMINAANSIGLQQGDAARITVGHLNVIPNGPSTIPGEVRFIVDFRHPEDAVLGQMQSDITEQFNAIAKELDLETDINMKISVAPVQFNGECIAAVRDANARLDYPAMEILSGAGHDAVYVSRKAPTSMIFVPSKDGISHNESEYSSPEDLEAGCNVLLQAMLSRANRPV